MYTLIIDNQKFRCIVLQDPLRVEILHSNEVFNSNEVYVDKLRSVLYASWFKDGYLARHVKEATVLNENGVIDERFKLQS